nr:hypothetical protein HK105_005603 [Polyrhizophydium stewartii]
MSVELTLGATASVGYCCLGTTRADAGSAEAFVKIDYAIPLQAAKMFKENGKGDQHYMLVTASGSNASSMFLYPRTKGELERDVQALGFSRLTILRPGLLDYRPDPRPSRRAWEEYAAPVVSFLAPRSGIIGVGLLGRAMRLLTEDWLAARAGGRTASEAGVRVLENAAILDVAERK